MIKERKVRRAGAERRSEPSPFGNSQSRQQWYARIEGFGGLDEALAALMGYRAQMAAEPLTDQDSLWIEARLEERVALLRFEEMTNEAIRTMTLTGESISAVQSRFIELATTADARELESLLGELRRRYKPPVMPSSPYLHTEIVIAELLIKRRSLNWFDTSIQELRERRNVSVLKEGLPEQ